MYHLNLNNKKKSQQILTMNENHELWKRQRLEHRISFQ